MKLDLETKDRFKKLEIEIARLKARLMNVDHRIPLESGGGTDWITGTKVEIDALIISEPLTQPQIAYATDLDRYYTLELVNNTLIWVADWEHCDVFPAIPDKQLTIELGAMHWHAGSGDTVWTLDSFVFTVATGEVGTDETGAVP